MRQLGSLLRDETYLASYERNRDFGSTLQIDRTHKQKTERKTYAKRISVSDKTNTMLYLNWWIIPGTGDAFPRIIASWALY